MVVKSQSPVVPAELDLGYLGLFLGLRINELVVERMAAKGFGDVRESYGYVIQHLIEAERSITELARRMEVTQQAASKSVADLLKAGVIEINAGGDRRSKRIRLSNRGWRCVRLARNVRRQLEERLIRSVGARKCSKAKRTLLRCLEELGGLPRIRSRRVRPPEPAGRVRPTG